MLVNGALLAEIENIGREPIRLRGWWVNVCQAVPERKRGPYRKAWMKRCGALGISPVRAIAGRVVHVGSCAADSSAADVAEAPPPGEQQVILDDSVPEVRLVTAVVTDALDALTGASDVPATTQESERLLEWVADDEESPWSLRWCLGILRLDVRAYRCAILRLRREWHAERQSTELSFDAVAS